mgnify:CR=1 FL=1
MGTRYLATMPSECHKNAAIRQLPNTYVREEKGSVAFQLASLDIVTLQAFAHRRVVVATNATIADLRSAGLTNVRELA